MVSRVNVILFFYKKKTNTLKSIISFFIDNQKPNSKLKTLHLCKAKALYGVFLCVVKFYCYQKTIKNT